MATDRDHPPPSVMNVSGLSPDAVRAVESFVADLRSVEGQPTAILRFVSDPAADGGGVRPTPRELASGPAVPSLPADLSRADLYDDHD